MEAEQKLCKFLDECQENIYNISREGNLREIIKEKLDCLSIRKALDPQDKPKDIFSVIQFDKIIKYFFEKAGLTSSEQGYIITKLLKYNSDIIYSEPYSYADGVIASQKNKEVIAFYKQYLNRIVKEYLGHESCGYEKKALEQKVQDDEKERLKQVQLYTTVQDFLNKEKKTEEDYLKITSVLKKLKVPGFMIQSFLSYQGYEKKQAQPLHLEAFKRPIKQETKRSKKELKTALQSYLASENFDYANYEDVVSILRQLNYPETQITNVMYELFNKAIINYAYYKYIYKKYAMLYPKEPILKEILDMASAMMIPESEEDYIFWKNQIIALLEKMQGEAQTNDAYDLKRVYCPKK